jgi:hypothetical protein
MPLILARIYEEDVKMPSKTPKFKLSPNSLQKTELSDAEKLIENLSSTVEYRNNAQRNSRNLQETKMNRLSVGKDSPLDSDFNFDDLSR